MREYDDKQLSEVELELSAKVFSRIMGKIMTECTVVLNNGFVLIHPFSDCLMSRARVNKRSLSIKYITSLW